MNYTPTAYPLFVSSQCSLEIITHFSLISMFIAAPLWINVRHCICLIRQSVSSGWDGV